MTRAKIFETIATHLLTQGQKAMVAAYAGGILHCAYRTPTGLRCAIGCLIPDEDYRPQWEGAGVMPQETANQIFGRETETLGIQIRLDSERQGSLGVTSYFLSKGYDLNLLKDLQYIHDVVEVKYWERVLTDYALTNGFQVPMMRKAVPQ